MKRMLIAAMAAMLFAGVAFARDYEQARAAAMDFYGLDTPAKLAPASADASQQEPYYVFPSPAGEGFVIISGNDRMPAVVGYSDAGQPGGSAVPPQLRLLLEAYGQAASYESHSRDDEDGKLLETALFNQYEPFNSLCPDNGVTGCVATAMSIVMKYHNWPARGRGSHAYVWNGKKISCDFDFDFDWANILDNYNDGWTKTQGEAVARLMLAAGVSVEMMYTPYNSGAADQDVPNALIGNFCYSPEIVHLKKDLFGDDAAWNQMLRDEIDAGRPLMYSGGPKDEKADVPHIFVIDGYKGDFYHVNWGWGGQYNGYYLLTGMAPANVDYSYRQAAIVHIKPDAEMLPYSPVQMQWQYGQGHGLLSSVERVKAGKDFMVNLSCACNIGLPRIQSGELGVALVDANGNIRDIADTQAITLESTSYYYFNQFDYCKTSVAAQQGDMLVAVYRPNADTPWTLVSGDGFVSASASAYDNKPVTAPVKWKVGTGISSTVVVQSKTQALVHGIYLFAFSSTKVPNYQVKVNGQTLESFTSSGSWKYFQYMVESADEILIECDDPDGIASACSDELSVAVSGRSVAIANLLDGEEWTLCDLAGRLAMRGSSAQFDVPAPGVYILSIAGQAVKIAIR